MHRLQRYQPRKAWAQSRPESTHFLEGKSDSLAATPGPSRCRRSPLRTVSVKRHLLCSSRHQNTQCKPSLLRRPGTSQRRSVRSCCCRCWAWPCRRCKARAPSPRVRTSGPPDTPCSRTERPAPSRCQMCLRRKAQPCRYQPRRSSPSGTHQSMKGLPTPSHRRSGRPGTLLLQKHWRGKSLHGCRAAAAPSPQHTCCQRGTQRSR